MEGVSILTRVKKARAYFSLLFQCYGSKLDVLLKPSPRMTLHKLSWLSYLFQHLSYSTLELISFIFFEAWQSPRSLN